ncbi:MAG: hypothetical protein Q8K21_01395 [Hydrogenophaga sp.]|uniref:hypothetical protein n=1 Tax=Hydrogenophaga sp. TaxID=1904254 RepID=UPI0027310DFC|nr:hypothetical protein [Hydrogenophaga sp.]MDP2162876.1 hypothetical protein [Hydrogenophaga sp.]MDP3474400.1 hypothetical protein [Hydrogenophaga sp.]
MLTFKNNTLRRWVQMLGACVLVATLSACGGGGDDVPGGGGGGGGGTTTITPPATNPSSGFTQPGNLNYLVTAADGSTRTVAATVAYSTPKGTLTLGAGTTDSLTVTTADAWANVTWPVGVSGALRADGNAVFVCEGAVGAVGMSDNMTPVTDLTVLHGLSFQSIGCSDAGPDTSSAVITFNADGSATSDAGTSFAETISAADITPLFSPAGRTDYDGSNYKLQVYAYTAGGVTQYHIVEIGDDAMTGDSARIKYVGLFSAPDRR